MHYCLGQMTRAEEAFQEFERRFEHNPGNLLLARSRITQSIVYLYLEEYDRGTSAIQAALPVLQAEGDVEHVIWGQGMLGAFLSAEGRLQESIALTTQAYVDATAIQNKVRQAMSRNYGTTAEIYAGRLDEATAHAEECLRLGAQVQAAVPIAFGQNNRGYALFLQGRRQEGIALMREAILTVRAAGTKLGTSWFLSRLAEALALSGDAVEARKVAEECTEVLQMGNRWGQVLVERALGIGGALEGSADWRRHFEESIRLATERKARPELALSHFRYAEALAQTEDLSLARSQLETAEALFREIGMSWWLEQASALRNKLG